MECLPLTKSHPNPQSNYRGSDFDDEVSRISGVNRYVVHHILEAATRVMIARLVNGELVHIPHLLNVTERKNYRVKKFPNEPHIPSSPSLRPATMVTRLRGIRFTRLHWSDSVITPDNCYEISSRLGPHVFEQTHDDEFIQQLDAVLAEQGLPPVDLSRHAEKWTLRGSKFYEDKAVIPSQPGDDTKTPSTFSEGGAVSHVSPGAPVSGDPSMPSHAVTNDKAASRGPSVPDHSASRDALVFHLRQRHETAPTVVDDNSDDIPE